MNLGANVLSFPNINTANVPLTANYCALREGDTGNATSNCENNTNSILAKDKSCAIIIIIIIISDEMQMSHSRCYQKYKFI